VRTVDNILAMLFYMSVVRILFWFFEKPRDHNKE